MTMKFSLVTIVGVGILALGCGKSADKPKTTDAPEKPGLTKLNIIDIVKGSGETLESGDKAFVTYKGMFANGSVFDSNVGKSPTPFVIGVHQVVDGWDKGLPGMKVGGKRRLEIPWNMAYGEAGRDKIPPKADLYFEIELTGITKAGDEGKVILTPITEGHGPLIKNGDRVSAHALFKLSSGKVVQDSKRQGGVGLYTFTVGNSDQVIPAVDSAVKAMREGGKYTLKLPQGMGPQKGMVDATPSDTWIVEMEIVKVVRG